jgi:cell division protein FtsN
MGLLSKFKIRRSDKPAPRRRLRPCRAGARGADQGRRRLIGVTLLLVIGIIGFPCCSRPSRAPSRSTSRSRFPPATGPPRCTWRRRMPLRPRGRGGAAAGRPTGSDAGADEVIEPTVLRRLPPRLRPRPPEVKKAQGQEGRAAGRRRAAHDQAGQPQQRQGDAHKDGGKTASADTAKPKDSKPTDTKPAKSAAASKPRMPSPRHQAKPSRPRPRRPTASRTKGASWSRSAPSPRPTAPAMPGARSSCWGCPPTPR